VGKLGGVGVCLGHSSENYRLDAVLAKKQAAELSDWISKGACRFVAAYIILCFFSTPSVPGSTGQAAMKRLAATGSARALELARQLGQRWRHGEPQPSSSTGNSGNRSIRTSSCRCLAWGIFLPRFHAATVFE